MNKKILIVNGSVGGDKGNTAAVLKRLELLLSKQCEVHINHSNDLEELWILPHLGEFDGFVFGTGTYWDGWGSPLQQFFENITELEGAGTFLGKPAAIIVTEHSEGGKAVLSRIQGVLNTFGFYVPPMSGMVYSHTNHLLLHHGIKDEALDDVWCLEDLDTIAHNLVEAVNHRYNWKSWEVDRKSAKRSWMYE